MPQTRDTISGLDCSIEHYVANSKPEDEALGRRNFPHQRQLLLRRLRIPLTDPDFCYHPFAGRRLEDLAKLLDTI